jgi:phosphoglycolate phosphatase
MIDASEARQYMSRGGLDMVTGLLAETCVDPAADLADFRARYGRRQTPPDTVFPDVAEGLARMRDAGLILSICSNKPQKLCENVLRDTGLADFFTVVVGVRAGLRAKPAPDLLDAVLADLSAAPDECLFVGDSELDHDIAQRAMIPFQFLSYGYAAAGWTPEAGVTFDCFRSLTDAIVAHRGYA